MIDKLKLLAGDERIEIDGIVFKQPKLRNIKDVGLQVYYAYISFLLVGTEEYLISIKREDLIPFFKQHNLTMFDIYRDNPYERQFFIEALSFFIDGEIEFKNGEFLIISKLNINEYRKGLRDFKPVEMEVTKSKKQEEAYDFSRGRFTNNTNIINKEIYQKILEIIAEINCLKVNKQQETYANEKARKIAEKIQQAKQKRSNVQSKDSVSLPDIISAVASRKESLNLLNIWDLTIYQLYDHYNRLIVEDEFDIHAMNYAYWGGEFKAKHWSKQLDY